MMSDRDDRNVVEMRCYPVNAPEPERLTSHSWWWLAAGIFLASFIPLDPHLTQATQVIAGGVMVLPAAMGFVRRWNARAGSTPV
jgi:hypothetical protein